MLTFMLHIMVGENAEEEALDTLSAIERQSLHDAGRLHFSWFQHLRDPQRFTLFEQWESQEHLDAHLAKDPSLWNGFQHCLIEEPISEGLRTVADVRAERQTTSDGAH